MYRYRDILIFFSLIISLQSCIKDSPLRYRELNSIILDRALTNVCTSRKGSSGQNSEVHVIRLSNELCINFLQSSIPYDPETEFIFNPTNLGYFKEQLENTPQTFFQEILGNKNECYFLKEDLDPKSEIPPQIYFPQDYILSPVVFTKDQNFALYISGKDELYLQILKIDNGNFVPFKTIFLAVF